MWTWLANCKKRPTDFLLKLHDGEQCTSVVQFASAWKLKWKQINKEKGAGNTKLQRCDFGAPLADVHLNLKYIILC